MIGAGGVVGESDRPATTYSQNAGPGCHKFENSGKILERPMAGGILGHPLASGCGKKSQQGQC